MIYITYEDEGPKGICCQSCSITSPWKKLFIINDIELNHERLDVWIDKMNTMRKNAKIKYIYYDDGLSEDVKQLNLK